MLKWFQSTDGPRNRRLAFQAAGNHLLLILAVAAINGCVALNGNFRPVAEGEFYRSGQLSADGLDRRVRNLDLKTVINLRGPDVEDQWYQDEVAVCDRRDVDHHSVSLSKNRLPKPETLAQLIHLFETSEPPLLVHCQGGTHRSSVAAACYLLLQGEEVKVARRQLDVMFFNDAPIGRLLDLYAESDEPFDRWVRETYPGVYAEETGTRPSVSSK